MTRLRNALSSRRGETIVEVIVACVLVLMLLAALGGAVQFAARAQRKAAALRAQISAAQESLRTQLASGTYASSADQTIAFRATNSSGSQVGANVLFRVPVRLRAVDADSGVGSNTIRFYLYGPRAGTGGGG